MGIFGLPISAPGPRWFKALGTGTKEDPHTLSVGLSDGETDLRLTNLQESDDSLRVTKQDQHTPVMIAKFNQVQASTTLTVQAVIDAYTITVASGTGLVNGRYIILFHPASERYSVFTVVSFAGLVVTLDTPIDFAYPVGTFVDIAITNMNVNGSGTPEFFGLRGTGAPPGIDISVDITRILFHCLTDTAVDLSKFADLTKLTRGLVMRARNGDKRNIFNVKSNGEIAGIMLDWIPYAKTNPVQGVDGFTARLTFNGDDKMGVTQRLPIGEDLEVIIQDDLTDIVLLEIVAEGHIVQD
jgi:hypothetical protein